MKAMELLTLLGELDEASVSPVQKRPKHRPLWVAAAACFFACLLGFSAWFFLPPSTITNQSAKSVVIRIDDRLVSYYVINTAALSRFERMRLPDTPSEILCTHGGNTFYRAQGENDLVYIIQQRSDGSYAVLKFHDYVSIVGMDMTDSLLTANGWFTDADIAALDGLTEPTMDEIWETIYGVTSHADVQSIRFEKDRAYNGGVSKRIKIAPITVKDSENLARIYDLLVCMTPAEYGQALPYDYVDAHDEAYLSGKKPLSAQVNRDLTVTLASGRKLMFYYYPATGLLRQHGTEMYTVLSEPDNQWLIRLVGIDMDWQDWGTEEPLVYGDGCETATAPAAPEK
ncbi:MAG: hypothetical protein IJX72_07855 [Clostridia bacterium]|nr:hypothetical protein [Clostridia bacterium]